MTARAKDILILDDDMGRHHAFARTLIGNAVVHVCTAKEAIQAMSQRRFDIVFLDHDLGGGSVPESSGPGTGYEVACWVRDNPERQPQTIIVHSFNPVGARNMLNVLPPGASWHPGIWNADTR